MSTTPLVYTAYVPDSQTMDFIQWCKANRVDFRADAFFGAGPDVVPSDDTEGRVVTVTMPGQNTLVHFKLRWSDYLKFEVQP